MAAAVAAAMAALVAAALVPPAASLVSLAWLQAGGSLTINGTAWTPAYKFVHSVGARGTPAALYLVGLRACVTATTGFPSPHVCGAVIQPHVLVSHDGGEVFTPVAFLPHLAITQGAQASLAPWGSTATRLHCIIGGARYTRLDDAASLRNATEPVCTRDFVTWWPVAPLPTAAVDVVAFSYNDTLGYAGGERADGASPSHVVAVTAVDAAGGWNVTGWREVSATTPLTTTRQGAAALVWPVYSGGDATDPAAWSGCSPPPAPLPLGTPALLFSGGWRVVDRTYHLNPTVVALWDAAGSAVWTTLAQATPTTLDDPQQPLRTVYLQLVGNLTGIKSSLPGDALPPEVAPWACSGAALCVASPPLLFTENGIMASRGCNAQFTPLTAYYTWQVGFPSANVYPTPGTAMGEGAAVTAAGWDADGAPLLVAWGGSRRFTAAAAYRGYPRRGAPWACPMASYMATLPSRNWWNYTCAPCTLCTPGERYTVSYCDGSHNAVCHACTPCANGTLETAPCQAMHDTVCAAPPPPPPLLPPPTVSASYAALLVFVAAAATAAGGAVAHAAGACGDVAPPDGGGAHVRRGFAAAAVAHRTAALRAHLWGGLATATALAWLTLQAAWAAAGYGRQPAVVAAFVLTATNSAVAAPFAVAAVRATAGVLAQDAAWWRAHRAAAITALIAIGVASTLHSRNLSWLQVALRLPRLAHSRTPRVLALRRTLRLTATLSAALLDVPAFFVAVAMLAAYRGYAALPWEAAQAVFLYLALALTVVNVARSLYDVVASTAYALAARTAVGMPPPSPAAAAAAASVRAAAVAAACDALAVTTPAATPAATPATRSSTSVSASGTGTIVTSASTPTAAAADAAARGRSVRIAALLARRLGAPVASDGVELVMAVRPPLPPPRLLVTARAAAGAGARSTATPSTLSDGGAASMTATTGSTGTGSGSGSYDGSVP